MSTNPEDENQTPPRKRTRRSLKSEIVYERDTNCSAGTDGDTQAVGTKPSPSLTGYQTWSVEELVKQLEEHGLEDIAEIFRKEKIQGKHLPQITEERLKKMGVLKTGRLLDFQEFQQNCICPSKNTYDPDTKIFNDPIHGHIELHPLCVKIIDTCQFQRLRFLKQLGACYFVFPGASHNRFEHSIGVCHLAGQLTRTLQRRQPDLQISDEDVLCVEIAGLCHDLGHGPFSHLFDGEFIPQTSSKKWKHEDASVKMFDYLVEVNKLKAEFTRYKLTERDQTFIKEQIKGPLQTSGSQTGYQYQGRSKEKSFLYEIVANKRNGIDVDKWDYFARDCHMLGIRNNFDHNRFMKFSRVINVDGVMQVCARDKEASTLYDMFHTRSSLHRRAYQHKVNKIIEAMIVEALIKANDYIKIPGKNQTPRKMSECIEDMEAYTKLTDYVLQQIMLSTDPALEESQTIINNIMCRKLYKCVGQSQPSSSKVISGKERSKIKNQLIKCMSDEDKKSGVLLTEDDLVVHMVYLDYGMKEKNPVENVRFYNKADPDKAIQVRKSEVSNMLPDQFAEQMILVYCKDRESVSKLGIASRCFINWCAENNMKSPKQSGWEMTPVTKRDSTPILQVTPTNERKDSSTKRDTPRTAGKSKQKLTFTEK